MSPVAEEHSSGNVTFVSVLQLHKQADMQEEKNRIERVLGAISAPDLIQKVLSFALSVRTNSFIDVSLRKYSPLFVFSNCSSPENEMILNFGLPQQDEVRPQDTVSVIGGVAGSSKQGRKAAWKFVKDNWEELYNRYQGGFLISRLVKVRTPRFYWMVVAKCVSLTYRRVSGIRILTALLLFPAHC